MADFLNLSSTLKGKWGNPAGTERPHTFAGFFKQHSFES